MTMADAARRQIWGVSDKPSPSWLARVIGMIAVWHRRARDRQALRRLDDHYLRDIGLTRHETLIECAKPFWRA